MDKHYWEVSLAEAVRMGAFVDDAIPDDEADAAAYAEYMSEQPEEDD